MSQPTELTIVGIGASAESGEAIEALFATMPADPGMAFVVIQQTSSNITTHMRESLGRQTGIPVTKATEGLLVEANNIYRIPENHEVVITAGRLHLTERNEGSPPALLIDQFFRSLANDAGRRSVGIILSGTGGDGSRGIVDIKNAGGLVIVQEEDSAKFADMPVNAQAAGIVDLLLEPSAIAAALKHHVEEKNSEQRDEKENLQATIEELLSTNKELLAANEEMQSATEALHSINTDYKAQIAEIARVNGGMDNLLALTKIGVLFVDENSCIRRYTPVMQKLFQLIPEDLGRSIYGFKNRLSETKFYEAIQKCLLEGAEVEEEITDRQDNPYLLRIAPYTQPHGINGAVLTLIDISDLKAARGAADLFKHMSDHTEDMHIISDLEGIIEYANPATCKATGYSEESLIGGSVGLIYSETESYSVSDIYEGTKNGDSIRFTTRLSRVDHSTFPVEIVTSSVKRGSKTLLFGTVRDITQRTKVLNRLRLYRKAVEATNSGVIIANAKNPNCEIIFANEAFYRLTEYTKKEVVGRNCRFLQGAETDPAKVAIIRKALSRGQEVRATILNYKKSGATFWNDLVISPVFDRADNLEYFVGIQNDVTKEIEESADSQERAATLATLLNSTAEGIYGIDTEGRCTFVNKSALRMLGYASNEQLVGKHIHDLIHHTREDGSPFPRHECEIGKNSATGIQIHKTHDLFWCQDGSSIPVEYHSTSIRLENYFTGAVVTFSNITTRLAKEKELLEARQNAEFANRAKSEFVANMSHEIRTPLTAVTAYSDLLLANAESEKTQKSAAAIKRNAQSLVDIVDDILDLSKIEAEIVEIQFDMFSLPSLLFDLQSMMYLRAQEKGLKLDFQLQSPIPETILSDRKRMRQILVNLIGNAIKFTSQGSIQVAVGYAPRELRIQVVDTGIGIEKDDQANLFQPFGQANNTISQRFGGTGLGLNISKRLAEKLGGSISLISEIGRGSTFTVTVPINKHAEVGLVSELNFIGESNANPEIPMVKLPENCRIGLADDQPDIRDALSGIFESAGANVTVFSDGEEIFNAVVNEHCKFDAIVLDIQMPRMDGLACVAALREHNLSLPVIAVTAQAMHGEREKCLAAGFDEYFCKPVNAARLIQSTADLMNEHLTPNEQRILMVDDHRDTVEALSALLSQKNRTIRTTDNAPEALEIFKRLLPSLVILDIHIGEYDGVELMNEMKQLALNQDTTFIAITGLSSESDREFLLGTGFNDVITKPVDMLALKALVDAPS